ncbi:hypothetical protein Tco_1309654 [Tanacetum coccineum]
MPSNRSSNFGNDGETVNVPAPSSQFKNFGVYEKFTHLALLFLSSFSRYKELSEIARLALVDENWLRLWALGLRLCTLLILVKMPNTRSGASMTREEFEELVNRRVAEEIEAREAVRTLEPLNENGDELEGKNGGNEIEEMEEMEMEEMEIEMGIMA